MKLKRNQCIIGCFTAKELNAPEKAAWFQTPPPYGEYPAGNMTDEHGKPVKDAVVVFDEESVRKTVEAFRAEMQNAEWPGVLVDREHFSLSTDKPSDAMAWAKDIRQEADGSIWTRWEFTEPGEKLWNDKVLINRSPAFCCEKVGKDYRPTELRSIGMTNTPHFKELSNLAAARAADVSNNEGEIHMNEILKALGLGEGADEAAAVAAINALKEKASAAEAKATDAEKAKDEAEGKCRAMECDKFLEANKDKIADVAACREVYMANPEQAKKLIAACKAAEPKKPQTVLAAAKATPQAKGATAFATCREEMNALPPNQRQAFYLAHKADIDAGK